MNRYWLAAKHIVNYGYQRLHLATGWTVGRPTAIHAAVSLRCFLKCCHCNLWKMDHDQKQEMSTEEWCRTIDGLVDWLGRGVKINFGGGEPFIRPDMLKILHHAVEKGALPGVVSNGVHISSPKMARALVETGCFNVNLSLDGVTAATHDLIRGVTGSYAAVVKAAAEVNRFRKELNPQMALVIKTVVLKQNYHEMVDLAHFVKEQGYSGILFQPLQQNLGECAREGWHRNNPLWPEPGDYGGIERQLEELATLAEKKWPTLNSPRNLREMLRYFRDPELPSARNGACQVGINSFNIRTNGDVSLCSKMETVGNVRKQSPRRIWHSATAVQRRDEVRNCTANCLLTCQAKRSLAEKCRLFLGLVK